MKTLIVEDNKTSGKLLKAVLESEGFDAIVAEDGKEAMLTLEAQSVDCIISDAMMPNVNGYRLVHKVRSSHRLKNIPFIMYTAANASIDDEQFAFSLGVNRYIRKPASTREIVKAVRELFESKDKDAGNGANHSDHDQWIMQKYGRLLIDELEDNIETLEKVKNQLERNEHELQRANAEMEQRVRDRTYELQLALEKEKELVTLKSRFISTVSHDFRTPLTAINFQTGLIKRHGHQLPWEDVLERMSSIEQQLMTMTNLLDDLLIVGKGEAGKICAVNQEIDGETFFRGLVKEVAHSTNDTHVIQPYINLMQEKLVSDPMLLRNVVINLLGNAVKYSPVATPVYFGATQENENLIIEVKDLGIGISEDEQEIIFESFTRGKNVGAIRGTGLGLSIVKKAVELLGGGITVTSTVNEGSAFKVRIPLAL